MKNIIYAVGDIHGCLDQLIELQEKIKKDAGKRSFKVIYLGDYVDRGSDSKGVIDNLMKQENAICLKGNHEDMMISQFDTGSFIYIDLHLNNGGMETLNSYGLKIEDYEWDGHRPNEHKKLLNAYKHALGSHYEWMKSLKLYHIEDGCVFVHAGVEPNREMDQQSEQVLLWTRKLHFIDIMGYKYRVVHGHSPVQRPDVTQFRINVDTASCFGGCLTAAKLVDGKLEGFVNTGSKIF
jgi:serine/threonine protein phosphatase 1